MRIFSGLPDPGKRGIIDRAGTVAIRFVVAFAALFLISTSLADVGQRQLLQGHVPTVVAKSQPVGRLTESQQLHLAVGLPLRNADELNELIQELYDPTSPNYRHYLTAWQFAERFGPTEADYEKLKTFANANHLVVTATHENRTLLDVRGTVADIERAFQTTLRLYQHPAENRKFFAPDIEPSLALDLPVLSISGLNNYLIPHPMDLKHLPARAAANATPLAGSGPAGNYLGNDFRAAYAPSNSLTGAGQSVGLLEFDGYFPNDITAYANLGGLPAVTLTNVLLDGFSGSAGTNNDEVALDIQMAMSMAPGLASIIVYEGDTPDDILNRMATDNLAKQLSSSWTFPVDAATAQIYLQYAAQGQSYFNASGDDGAYAPGTVASPTDETNITCVGGTTLTTTGRGGPWASEKVWNWNGTTNGPGASGGGISTRYLIPSYQKGISMAANLGSTTHRNIPDVAMVADGIWSTFDNGSSGAIGGTSASTPLWAGLTALINQQATANGNKATVGFLNPAIYAIGKSTNYASAFHDIITGNNISAASPTKFFAVAGYDLCTGWGTPKAANLVRLLASPTDPLQITPGTGFASVGRTNGPFTVTTQKFTLTNSGAAALTWAVSNSASWLKVSTNGGTLNPGASTAVTIGLNAAASNLVNGIYSTTVWFTNLNTSVAQSRAFSLTIGTVSAPSLSALQFALKLGGTIELSFNGTITVTNPLQIATNTVLDATGHSVILSGGNLTSIININPKIVFSATNITFAAGKTRAGNGVNGATNLGNGSVGNNAANGTNALGGAVYNQGTNFFVKCTFLTNSATGGNGGNGGYPPPAGTEGGNGGNGGVGYGGAIYNLRYVVLTNCVFTGNSAIGGNGGTSPAGKLGPGVGGTGAPGEGGVVYNASNATLLAFSCTFNSSVVRGGTSQEGGGPIDGNVGNPGAAGGMALGGVTYNQGTNFYSDCQFTGSTVTGGAGGGGAPGSGVGGNGGNGGSAQGGGIFNSASATITNCTFSNITITGGAGGTNGTGPVNVGVGGTGGLAAGAVIFNGVKGTVHTFASTLNNNTAQGGASQEGGGAVSGNNGNPGVTGGTAEGGAIANNGTNTAVNCTFFENTVLGGAGGMGGPGGFKGGQGGTGGSALGGGIFNNGLTKITNCTFSTGAAQGGKGGAGGVGPSGTNVAGAVGVALGANFDNNAGTFIFKNSISASPQIVSGANGTITDGGYNISSDATPVFGATSRNKLNPELLKLTNNGGPTETMALATNSPAIDAIFDNSAPPFDQRGISRPQGPRSDIGAYEFVPTNSISGMITAGTNGVSGTVVLITGSNSVSAMTGANGNYSQALAPGTYTVTPQPSGYFSPPSLSIVLTSNLTGLNFSVVDAAAAATYSGDVGSNDLQLSFHGIPGVSYTIQASTNLVNWQIIGTGSAPSNGIILFSDSTTNFPSRFYRAVP